MTNYGKPRYSTLQKFEAALCCCSLADFHTGTSDARISAIFSAIGGLMVVLVSSCGVSSAVWVGTESAAASGVTFIAASLVMVAVLGITERVVREIRAGNVPINGTHEYELKMRHRQKTMLMLILLTRLVTVTAVSTIAGAGLVTLLLKSEARAQLQLDIESSNQRVLQSVQPQIDKLIQKNNKSTGQSQQVLVELTQQRNQVRNQLTDAEQQRGIWRALANCEFAGLAIEMCRDVESVPANIELTGLGGPGIAYERFSKLSQSADSAVAQLEILLAQINAKREKALDLHSKAIAAQDAKMIEIDNEKSRLLHKGDFISDPRSVSLTWMESLKKLDKRSESHPRTRQIAVGIIVIIVGLEAGLIFAFLARANGIDSIDVAIRLREELRAEQIAAELFSSTEPDQSYTPPLNSGAVNGSTPIPPSPGRGPSPAYA